MTGGRLPGAEGGFAVDPYAQALKALSERSPYPAGEEAARPSTLPPAAAALLSGHSDGRRNHKKSHGDAAHKKSSNPPTPPTVWDATEEYFRPLTLADMETLAPGLAFRPTDPCLSIAAPRIRNPEPATVPATVRVSSAEGQPKQEPQEPKQEPQEPAEVELHTVEVERSELEVDEAETCIDSLTAAEGTYMNWLLGSRYRSLLTSERPNKKRKLLGADAGLDQLLRLPYSDPAAYKLLCDVCFLGATGAECHEFLHCISCKVSVHRRCYGVKGIPTGPWLCSWCKHLEVSENLAKKDSKPCELCPREGGALKSAGKASDTERFVHLFCSIWAPEVYVEDTGAMEPVLNVGEVQETRRKLVCYLCKVKHGICVRCSYGTCRTSFHPICARESKHRMEIWGKFGCDNVELRAFCSKHSGAQDVSNSVHSESFGVNAANNSSLTKPPLGALVTNKLPKLKLNRSRERTVMQDEIMSSMEMVKNKNTQGQELSARQRLKSCDTPLIKNIGDNGIIGSGNNITSSPDLAVFLSKLISRGKVGLDDVASELGISSNSLEAALLGETTSFSPGLKLKIIKWLQNSAHIWKSRSDSPVSSVDTIGKVNGIHATEGMCPNVPVDVKFVGLETADADEVKSLPPRRRTKGNIRILKDNRETCLDAATIQQNGNGNLVDENGEIPVVLGESTKKDDEDEKSSLDNHDCCFKGQEHSEMTLDDTANPTDTSPSRNLPHEHKGDPSKSESNDLVAQLCSLPVKKGVPSSESSIDQVDETNVTAPNVLQGVCLEETDDHSNLVVSGCSTDIDSQSCHTYVHPLIERRMMQMQRYSTSKHTYGEASSNGHCEKMTVAVEGDIGLSPCKDLLHRTSCTDIDYQLSKAKTMGFLELSPEDEVEGEMLYLQTRLLDKAVAIKHNCEDIVLKVVQNLPRELDAFSKRRWDLILVTRYLREVREAKKRGRKERRHKEAQAVLAAAAAAAAASSRNSSLRKDTTDEGTPNHQESPLKISAVSGRARIPSPLAPGAKDSRSVVVKMSSDKNSGTIQTTDSSEEATLSCDICRRTESLLNRIFVCSCCKVAVHLDCYRELKNPVGPWVCELCEEMSSQSSSLQSEITNDSKGTCFDTQCGLCGGVTGAFRKSTDGRWVHAYCAEWLLESRYRRGQQNPVEGVDSILKEKNARSCCICCRNVGVCLKCSYGHCQVAFHPSCARVAGLYMNVKAGGGRLQHKAYCEKHSLEQRESDSQLHGAEEFKTIKQIRVALERARLLCERIIRREKLKRDLVLCSHDILASRRDNVAFSVLVRSSFFTGDSSESATTSVNDVSYSETIQRSDDVTVDSTVSGRHSVRLPVHADTDRKTDDSSTSRLTFKRKLTDRTQFSGKQLPQRHASASSQIAAEDGEQRSKARKHTETFQKEVVMTFDQASVQNQRLPKGFVYIPVGHLPKETPATHDSEPREQLESGG